MDEMQRDAGNKNLSDWDLSRTVLELVLIVYVSVCVCAHCCLTVWDVACDERPCHGQFHYVITSRSLGPHWEPVHLHLLSLSLSLSLSSFLSLALFRLGARKVTTGHLSELLTVA